MTTSNVDLGALPTITSYTRSRTGSGVIGMSGTGGSVWTPLPTGVSTIQFTGYGDATVRILISSETNFGGTVAERELECTTSGASTVLSGVGTPDGQSRYLYVSTTASVNVSAVITTFPL